MSLFIFLTVVQALVALALVIVVLMQRSEGGGLGIGGGGSPGGLMSARGAADFLTRTTKWLAIVFVALSIALAIVSIRANSGGDVDQSLDRSVTPAQQGGVPQGLEGVLGQGQSGGAAAPVVPASAAPQDDAQSGVAE
ncbi:preprotein translocase subunit SecG [Alteraurantiacibacter buctensis]|uniref:Protein-export membrane protein SecG n=1 Tax=Alteraurantiacibacter buctensis TaxID=1503981 RepID=A0A844Z1E0_9SPHN|nr:preprotein translocase subunit SecG [Alteraurantiacibacter buctensis]MXO72257.1 preprotein translocase subunit SecG [Alteraurantiacibacter buctensis]